MDNIEIIALTVIVMWTINFIAAVISEEVAFYIAMGLVYPLIWVVSYPMRTWIRYSRAKDYYQKHGISRFQFLFGTRVKVNKEGVSYGR